MTKLPHSKEKVNKIDDERFENTDTVESIGSRIERAEEIVDTLTMGQKDTSEQESPLVTVIIPVYNVKDYLVQCLDSVINQTYKKLEILIIDDGSTDGSEIICDDYARIDGRIHVFHTANHGLSSARNLGLDHASGKYLFFLDSDDWAEFNAIEIMLNKALQTGARMVAANYRAEYIGESVEPQLECKETRIVCGEELLFLHVSGVIRNSAWGKLYHQACFSEIRYPDGHVYEDVPTTWRVLRELADDNETVILLTDVLFHYRKRKSSIAHSVSYRNYVDLWTYYHERFLCLPAYQEQLLPGCMSVIAQIWRNYYVYTKKEKAEWKPFFQEMLTFSRENFKRIITGDYPRGTKTICVLSQVEAPILMWLFFCFLDLKNAYISKPRTALIRELYM